MTSKAKQKGNSWEREICKFLGDTLGGNFQRVPNSGAYIGGKNVFRKASLDVGQARAAKGDIIPPDALPKLNLEAKNYKDIAFHQIINGECKQLNTWIEQTEEPADETDISFTIFKITRKGSWVAFRASLASNFELGSYVYYVKDSKKSPVPYIITDHESFFITNKDKIIALSGPDV